MTPRRILLADDEAHITHLLARRLEGIGHEVRVARDGEEAWAIVREWTPELLITDLQMPYVSGIELVRKLRSLPDCASTPVIMLTARGYVLDEQTVREAGISALLSKPFSVRNLAGIVEQILGEEVASRHAA